MAFVLDTNIAIHLRDKDPVLVTKVGALNGPLLLAAITRVELENGVYREPSRTVIRRARLDAMLRALPVLDFDAACVDAYGKIIASIGYSQRKGLDRMIAAQAIVHNATLVTKNGADFIDIPGLKLLAW